MMFDKFKLLCIMLPKMTRYAKCFGETKYMYFFNKH